ncbi:hypothetical protein ACT3CD_00145 [Geofilum sp. OHC36d9]|uniref:hypothetical protein n=1 Tax=Geofilum sp. OHC36d9 TaxID=3458413 RepID=UPI004034C455
MATKRTLTEAETFEQYRISLTNVENQSEIATIMAEFGYDTETIAQGKALLAETRQLYDANKIEDDETSAAYSRFSNLKEQLAKIYSLHRKKAKVVFRNDALTLDKLAVSGSLPKAHVKWLETVRKFYSVASTDTDLQSKLAKLKITADELAEATALVSNLEDARAGYLREIGESQDATKIKDAAFAKIDDWMSEFYAVAKIALEDSPQLQESLGKLVRS